jgi:hypothetical protein
MELKAVHVTYSNIREHNQFKWSKSIGFLAPFNGKVDPIPYNKTKERSLEH